jgi:outer membrane protein OmpA-like peptidoglycan-associated protein
MHSKSMLIALLGLAILPCAGQTSGQGSQAGSSRLDRFDFGLTFTEKLAKISNTTGTTFTLPGGSIDVAYNFPKWDRWAVAVDVQGETATKDVTLGYGLNQISYVGGPRYTFWRQKGVISGRAANFYGEALFGGMHAWDSYFDNNGKALTAANSWALQAGGGLNLPIARRFDVRVMEIDYILTKLPNNYDNMQTDVRFSTGLVFHTRAAALPPLTLACAASPTSVYPGDPVTVTSTADGLAPKLNTIYSFSGAGVTGNGATASVATGSLGAGTYTVNCGVKEGKAGKEGLEAGEFATASTTFAVKAFEPPTLSCTANPVTIEPGQTATVTATGVSPQNRPLTYSYSASSGAVNGNGASAAYSADGATQGAVAIICNVTDDKGHSAMTSTSLTILAPPPPPKVTSPEEVKLAARLAMHSVFFPTNIPGVKNPDGGLVASQQATLTTLGEDFKKYLEFQPAAHLTLIGHTDVRGSAEFNKALSERRVATTKHFLVGLGVPETGVETRGVGEDQQLTSDQVKALTEQDPDLTAAEKKKLLGQLPTIVLAQNRRVDIVLSTTGEQSVRLYPFNAADSMTLLDKKAPAPKQPKDKKKTSAK